MEDTSVKKKFVISLIAVLALGAMAAFAADVTGKWVGEMPGRGGTPTEITFDFQQNGETLTGTITGGMGGGRGGAAAAQEISEGKVSGDSISFAVVVSFNGNERRTTYNGTVSGSEMKLTSERPGRGEGAEPITTEITAKKAE